MEENKINHVIYRQFIARIRLNLCAFNRVPLENDLLFASFSKHSSVPAAIHIFFFSVYSFLSHKNCRADFLIASLFRSRIFFSVSRRLNSSKSILFYLILRFIFIVLSFFMTKKKQYFYFPSVARFFPRRARSLD